jgi:golgi phosphoprotein 3
MLSLFEELLLLSIHEDKGTFIRSVQEKINTGLVGAILAELALLGVIQIQENHRLHVGDVNSLEDDILNEALDAMKESEKDRKSGYWINAFTQKPEKIRKRITERLIEKGIVTQEDDHLLWVIPSPMEPEKKASTKYWIKRRLRSIILASEPAEQRDIALLGVMKACDLLDLVFLKDERRLASRLIGELVVSEALKNPVAQTIEEIGLAIAVVVEDD